MNKLFSALSVAAILAVAGAAGPASAQPARVIVHGANPIYVPSSPVYNGDNGYWTNYGGFYGDPLSMYYDPAGVVQDWRYHGPKAVDVRLGMTLSRNGESMLGHMLTCQARHATYSAATDMYYGRGGIPVACED